MEVFEKNVSKIRKCKTEYHKRIDIVTIQKKQYDDYLLFLDTEKKDKNLLKVFGILCFSALLFDYFVNSRTLIWLPNALRTKYSMVFLFAFIFSIIDAGIAIAASGLFAKGLKAKIHQQTVLRIILWSMAGLKIILFIYYMHSLGNLNADGLPMILLQVLFILLIYTMLFLAGEGIYYSLKSFLYFFVIKIWNNPEDKEKKYTSLLEKLNKKIIKYNDDHDAVYNHFGISNNIKD